VGEHWNDYCIFNNISIYLKLIYSIVQNVGVDKVFFLCKKSILYSPSLHLSGQKHSKISDIVKYYYNLK